MDSICYYHVCPRKGYFETLELKGGGGIHLENSEARKVQGMNNLFHKTWVNLDGVG